MLKLLYDIWQTLMRECDQCVGVEVDCVLIEIEVCFPVERSVRWWLNWCFLRKHQPYKELCKLRLHLKVGHSPWFSTFPIFDNEPTTRTLQPPTMSLTKLLNQKPTTERTFTFFTTLPPELWLKIWKYALPGPWVVRLSVMEHSNGSHRQGHEKYAIHATSAIPSMLQTNVEAC